MSTYKEIVGKKIKTISSDPSDSADGQMWYNTTTQSIRGLAILKAWSSSAFMITGVYSAGGGGPQTAAIVAGGNTQTGTTATTELYNGSGWSSVASMNTSRGGLGSSKDGSQTAHLVFGGSSNSTATELWNGSAWTTTPNSLNTGKDYTSGAGTSTAALNAGRWGPPMIGNTEEWNGTSWSEQNDLTTARGDMASLGTQTAAIYAGGNSGSPPNYRNLAEQYDGTSWTALPTLNTARGMHGSGAGSSTSGLVFGGNTTGPAASNSSEEWDGSSWTATPNLAEAGTRSGNGASASAGLAYGDYPVSGVTEEFNISTNTITAAAWASGGALPTPNGTTSGGGPQTAAVQASGADDTDAAAEYDGSSWTAISNLSTGRYGCGSSSRGSQTAMIIFSGSPNGNAPNTTATELWNGSSWTSGGAFASPNGKRNLVGGGTSTAAVSIGGYSHAPDAVNGYPLSTYLYDGSAWTTASPYNSGPNTGQERLSGGGPSTAALKIGGQYYNPATSPNYQNSNSTEEWNGSVWGTGGNFPANMYFGSMSGDSGNAITAFGNTGGPATPGNAFIYTGTSWVTAPSTGTARQAMGSGGTATAGLIFGGANNSGSGQNATEEITGVTIAGNVKTFSTS